MQYLLSYEGVRQKIVARSDEFHITAFNVARSDEFHDNLELNARYGSVLKPPSYGEKSPNIRVNK